MEAVEVGQWAGVPLFTGVFARIQIVRIKNGLQGYNGAQEC